MSSVARRNRFGVSTYSYWHFEGEKYPIERVIENAARLGFDGVEILHRQMTDEFGRRRETVSGGGADNDGEQAAPGNASRSAS